MSRLTVNYNPENAFALSFIDLMRKSGVFSFEDNDCNIEQLAHQYYDDKEEYQRVEAHHFFVGEPAPCACDNEEELMLRLSESEVSGVADDSEVEKVFGLWNAN